MTKRTKRGLVLEGGGGKGAYAFGCLLAFEEVGIRFDAVSGTSVGALNAVLWSTRRLAHGKEFWEGIWSSDVMRPRNPRWLFWSFEALLLMEYLVYGSDPRATRGKLSLFVNLVTVIAVMMPMALLMHGVIGVKAAIWVIGVLLLFRTLPMILWPLNFSVYSAAPLRESIDQVIGDADTEIATFVTVARSEYMFDPDNPKMGVTGYNDVGWSVAEAGNYPVPEYWSVDRMSADERRSVLIAATAIPMGIFPGKKIRGEHYFDAGIVDNCPMYPLVKHCFCDEVFVVRLCTTEEKMDDFVADWQGIDRLYRVAEMGAREASRRYNEKTSGPKHEMFWPPTTVPFNEPTRWPTRIYVFRPKESLGGFLDGTMRFEGKWAAELIEMGYRDTIETLSALELEWIRDDGG